MIYMFREIPEQIWRRFKAKCALKGVKVREQLLQLVIDWTQDLEDTGENETKK